MGGPYTSLSRSRGQGTPHTPTDFLPGPVGGPYTSLGWSWGQGTPLCPRESPPGARGQPQYLLELFLGPRGTPIAASPHPQISRRYTLRSHDARLCFIGQPASPLAIHHRVGARLHTTCGHPSCCDFIGSPTYRAVLHSPWPTSVAPAWGHVLIHSTPRSNPRMNPHVCRT